MTKITEIMYPVNQWVTREYPPSEEAGYDVYDRSVHIPHDGKPAEIFENNFSMKPWKISGMRTLIRQNIFQFPLFRKNGVTPLCLIDCVVYHWESMKMKSAATILTSSLNLMDAFVEAEVEITSNKYDSLDVPIHKPDHWDEVQDWIQSSPKRDKPIFSKKLWKKCGVYDTENSELRAEWWEQLCPWSILRNHKMQSAQLVIIKLQNLKKCTNGTVWFKGTTCGNRNQRSKLITSFIQSISPTICL